METQLPRHNLRLQTEILLSPSVLRMELKAEFDNIDDAYVDGTRTDRYDGSTGCVAARSSRVE